MQSGAASQRSASVYAVNKTIEDDGKAKSRLERAQEYLKEHLGKTTNPYKDQPIEDLVIETDREHDSQISLGVDEGI